MLSTDIGLGVILVALMVFMLWRAFDLLKKDGRWARDLAVDTKLSTEAEIEEKKRKLEELEATLKEVSK
jgi:hypothetical protein